MAGAPKTTTAPTGSIAPFGLRMLPDLRQRLEEAARSSGRSMNAEVVARLQHSFQDAPDAVALRQELAGMEKELLLLRHFHQMNEFTQHLLAQLVMDIHGALPPKLQEASGVAVRARLARGILEKDGEAMAEAMGVLLRVPEEERLKLEAEMKALRRGDLEFKGWDVVEGKVRAVSAPPHQEDTRSAAQESGAGGRSAPVKKIRRR